jgi:hypothetical protein
MKQKIFILKNAFAFFVLMTALGCKKESANTQSEDTVNSTLKANNGAGSTDGATSQFNLEVVLNGEGNNNGHIQFRQNPDAAKIIILDTKVHHLLANHTYVLQRAVDAINVVDGDCTSTSWLTLGFGLTPHAILTDDKGDGQDELWRDVSAVPSGSTFDIHFRVLDAVTMQVVLTSDCYQYTVR